MKGIKILEELINVCDSHLTREEDEKYLDKARTELKAKGPVGSDALADFIQELASCRSSKIGYALNITGDLEASPKLINTLKELASTAATNHRIPSLSPKRFQSELVGGGQIAWITGTAIRIKRGSDEALAKILPELTDAQSNLQKLPQESEQGIKDIPEDEKVSVAGNPNTPAKQLAALVRWALLIAHDDVEETQEAAYVIVAAAKNPSTPLLALEDISRQHIGIVDLTRNPNCPTHILKKIATCGNTFTEAMARDHPNFNKLDLDKIKSQMASGIDINSEYFDGRTFLTAACTSNQTEIAEWLINQGVSINVADRHGATPLTLAADRGNSKIVELLLARGADPNMYNRLNWYTPLIYASSKGYTDILSMLIKNGADLNAKNKVGYTALLQAANVSTAKILVDYGANINQKSINSEGVLFHAVFKSDPEMVKFFLQEGADISLKTNNGKTALDFVKRSLCFENEEEWRKLKQVEAILEEALHNSPALLKSEADDEILDEVVTNIPKSSGYKEPKPESSQSVNQRSSRVPSNCPKEWERYLNKYKERRLAAVKKLKDQETLAWIARNDEDINVRSVSVKKLDSDQSQELLEEIAKNDEHFYVRTAAVKKLEDQKVLAEIAKNDEEGWVRKAAVKKLEDQDLLANIAKNNKFPDTRYKAVKKLYDQQALAWIAENDKERHIRKKAGKRIKKLQRKNK